MIDLSTVEGVIFDVDETLLDTDVSDHVNALHERARLQAIYEAGKRHNLPELLAVAPEQNLAGFLDASEHSLEGAVWHIMCMVGLVADIKIDRTNPLLQEIVARKDELYEKLLREEGKPVDGAIEFVEWLAGQKFGEKLAIASTAIRRDIDIFLEKFEIGKFFPDERIIDKSRVAHVKPHPEAFDKAFLTLKLPEESRSHVLAFEDNPRGVMSAKAAGLYVCCITTMYSKEQLLALDVAPDLVADSYAEFRQLLEGSKVAA